MERPPDVEPALLTGMATDGVGLGVGGNAFCGFTMRAWLCAGFSGGAGFSVADVLADFRADFCSGGLPTDGRVGGDFFAWITACIAVSDNPAMWFSAACPS